MLICPACCRSDLTPLTQVLIQRFHIPVRLGRWKLMWIITARFVLTARTGLADIIASWFARSAGIT